MIKMDYFADENSKYDEYLSDNPSLYQEFIELKGLEKEFDDFIKESYEEYKQDLEFESSIITNRHRL
jgi:hypothetical protein